MGLFRDRVVPESITAAAVPAGLGMGAMRPAVAAPYRAQRGLTASAQRLPITDGVAQNRVYQAWQTDAWTGYEKIGEIHYGFTQTANILSKVRVYASVITEGDEAPMEISEAADKKIGGISTDLAKLAKQAMSELVADDFSAMMRAFTINISVPGDCLLVQLPDPETINPITGKKMVDPLTGLAIEPKKRWVIRSTDEIVVKGGQVEVIPMRGSTDGRRTIPRNTYIARIWKSHGRYSGEPDSSMSAISEPIEELLVLSRLVRSTTKSRLNAGMLFLPDDVVQAAATPQEELLDGDGNALPVIEDQGNQFIEDLIDSMVTPIGDETSAATVVPMLVKGPRESGEKIRHITFERRQSDEWLVNRAERALERVLQGIDVPKEIVTGLANVKYSNAIVIDDNYYKANIEPLCLMFVDAMTAVYLKPVLRARGVSEEDLAKITMWYDPSDIITRPTKAQDASDGYDKMLLSGAAWRREHGYSETDAPDEKELALMLMSKLGSLSDEVVAAILNTVLPTIMGKQREQAISDQPVDFPSSAANILQIGNRKGVTPAPAPGTAPAPVTTPAPPAAAATGS